MPDGYLLPAFRKILQLSNHGIPIHENQSSYHILQEQSRIYHRDETIFLPIHLSGLDNFQCVYLPESQFHELPYRVNLQNILPMIL